MLKKFEVENFKGFKENLSFDLTTNKKYVYNPKFVEKGIVRKALVFGENGKGKSNLCEALMDITFHLVDKQKDPLLNGVYLNGYSQKHMATFKYHFQFGSKRVIYEYAKTSASDLCYEKLSVNDAEILYYRYFDDGINNVTKIEGAEKLNKIQLPPQLSMIKFIYSNTAQEEKSIIRQIITYVNGMLYFKSLLEGNSYAGFRVGGRGLAEIILSKKKLQEFQLFLSDLGLNYNLVPSRNALGIPTIGVRFPSGKVVDFSQVVSSGTKTLWLFYCWYLDFDGLTMLIIDEFDAYYHFDLSKKILQLINERDNFQAVITSHNTYLINQEVTRPDCCYIIKDSQKIKPLCKLTKSEIRENKNIEHLYREGEFFIDWD